VDGDLDVGEMPEAIVVGIISTVRVRDFSPTTSTTWIGAAAIFENSCRVN
jgi:hypothetical protein